MKSNRFWIAIVAIFTAACLGLGAYLLSSGRRGDVAIITSDGNELYRLDLSEDAVVTVESENGTNVVVVENGTVRVSQADCPDQICVHQGAIDDDSVPIVCLPNRLVIEVTTRSQVDAVAG